MLLINTTHDETFDNNKKYTFDSFYDENMTPVAHESSESISNIDCNAIIKQLELTNKDTTVITLPTEYNKCSDLIKHRKFKSTILYEKEKIKRRRFILRTLINDKYYYLVITTNKKMDLPENKATKEKPETCNIGDTYYVPMLVEESKILTNYQPENYYFDIRKRFDTYVICATINNTKYFLNSSATFSPYQSIPQKTLPQYINNKLQMVDFPNYNSLKFICATPNINIKHPLINFYIESSLIQITNQALPNNIFSDKSPIFYPQYINIFTKDDKDRKFNLAISTDLDDPLKLDRIPLALMPVAYDECARDNIKCNSVIYDNNINYAGTTKKTFEIISIYV